jgi:predicted O-methyltransferase YrrM
LLVLPLEGMVFPEPGEYRVQLFSGEAPLLERRLLVLTRGLPVDSYDVIDIDGSHAAPDVLEDAVQCWRLLKPGGLVIFDDYGRVGVLDPNNPVPDPADRDHYPKEGIDAFCRCFAKPFDVVHNSYQLMIRKRPA